MRHALAENVCRKAIRVGRNVYKETERFLRWMLPYFLPMVTYNAVTRQLNPMMSAMLQGDLALLYIYRQDVNSVSITGVRHSMVMEKFPDYHPMNIWRTSNSGTIRLFWVVLGIFIIPSAIVGWVAYLDYLQGWWSVGVWLLMSGWLAAPTWNFARDMSKPRPIWVLRIDFDGQLELCDYASEYIEGAYSTEYAARVAESTALREFLKPRFTKDKGFWPAVPKTMIVLAVVVVIGIYLIYTSPSRRRRRRRCARGRLFPQSQCLTKP